MVTKKELACYNTDASRLIGNAEKVVFPKTIDEVKKIISSSKKDIVPRGSGTNLVGGCIPNNSIVVDMRKMNKVSKFNAMKKTVKVEAGVTLKELNEKLSRVGFEFPIETFNRGLSTIGGMVALNVPGFRSMKYGRIRDWVEEIDFINGRGELMKLGKSDLMDVCGMEGITGIIVSVTLKVIPLKKRSASIFQAEELEEVLSIARRLKLEKEVVMLEFFPPEVSQMLGLPNKYHLIIEFDSERGKVKGEEYKIISKFKYKVYDVLYSQEYYNSTDPKFFFDKLKEFVLFLESNQIPYFGYLDIGIIHPFFKENEKQKQQEVIDFIQKIRARPSKYGIGLNRKYLVDVFEKKVIQRVKLRHDPFGKLNKGKILDVKAISQMYSKKEAHHLKPVKKEEIEEIKPLIGEEKGVSEIIEELKTPNEKMEEFIEKVELMDKIAENEKPIKRDKKLEIIKEKEKKLELDNEIKERIKDYAQTFESELVEEKKKKIEDFALNIGRKQHLQSVEDIKKQKKNIDYKSIQNIMTGNYKSPEQKTEPKTAPVKNSFIDINNIITNNYNKEVEKGNAVIEDNLEKEPEKNKDKDRDLINNIMNNKFGFNKNKKEVSEEKTQKY